MGVGKGPTIKGKIPFLKLYFPTVKFLLPLSSRGGRVKALMALSLNKRTFLRLPLVNNKYFHLRNNEIFFLHLPLFWSGSYEILKSRIGIIRYIPNLCMCGSCRDSEKKLYTILYWYKNSWSQKDLFWHTGIPDCFFNGIPVSRLLFNDISVFRYERLPLKTLGIPVRTLD